MSVINELIRTEADGTISFGDYTLASKTKRTILSMVRIFTRSKHSVKLQSWNATASLSTSLCQGQLSAVWILQKMKFLFR